MCSGRATGPRRFKDHVTSKKGSVRASKYGALRGRFAAVDANARAAGLIERDAAHGGAGFLLNLRFAIRPAAPIGKRKTCLDRFFEILVGLRVLRVGFAEREGFVMQRLLNFGQQSFDRDW